MTDGLATLLRDAFGEEVQVRVREGRLQCEGRGSAALGDRLRAAADELRAECGDWDRYVTRRLREAFLELDRDCPKEWTSRSGPPGRNTDEGRALDALTFASREEEVPSSEGDDYGAEPSGVPGRIAGGDLARFEVALWQYQLAVYRAFRKTL